MTTLFNKKFLIEEEEIKSKHIALAHQIPVPVFTKFGAYV